MRPRDRLGDIFGSPQITSPENGTGRASSRTHVCPREQESGPTPPTSSRSTVGPRGPDYPAGGVSATSPPTAPDGARGTEGWPLMLHSANIHDNAAAAVATK